MAELRRRSLTVTPLWMLLRGRLMKSRFVVDVTFAFAVWRAREPISGVVALLQ